MSKISEDQVAVVEALREALELAEEGKISSCAIIACMADGFASVVVGRQASELNLGADALKAKILEAVGAGEVRSGGMTPMRKMGRGDGDADAATATTKN